MLEKLRKATPTELEIWMISATLSGIGLGTIFAITLSTVAFPLFIVSLAVHFFMMIKIYSK